MINLLFAKSKLEKEKGTTHLLVDILPESRGEDSQRPLAILFAFDFNGSPPPIKNWIKEFKKEDPLRWASSFNVAPKFLLRPDAFIQSIFSHIPNPLFESHDVHVYYVTDQFNPLTQNELDLTFSMIGPSSKKIPRFTFFGVGTHYDGPTLSALAILSGGRYEHIRHLDQLNSSLSLTKNKAKNLNVQDATLSIQLPRGLHLSPNVNGFYEPKKGEVWLGNLPGPQTLVFEVTSKERLTSPFSSTFLVRYEYRDANGISKSIEQHVRLPLVHEIDMKDTLYDEATINKTFHLLHSRHAYDQICSEGNSANYSLSYLHELALYYSSPIKSYESAFFRFKDSLSHVPFNSNENLYNLHQLLIHR